MCEHSRHSFVGTFLKTFKKSVLLQVAIVLLSIFVDALMAILMFWLSGLFLRFMGVSALLFISACGIFIYSVRCTFFSLWRPYTVVEGINPIKAFSKSLSVATKHFFKIFSQILVGVVLLMSFNVCVAFFTCGAGLVVSLGASLVIVSLYQLVLYYSINNKRYYIDNQTVTKTKIEKNYLSVEEILEAEDAEETREDK